MFIDRSKLNDYTLDFGDTKVIWHHYTPLIVPDDFTVREEKYLLAALQTLFCGNTSVDNILRSQFASYEDEKKVVLKESKDNLVNVKRKLVSNILKDTKKLYKDIYDTLESIDVSGGTESTLVCDMIFTRLHSSFKACRFLIKYGYFFETYAIQRQIIEQLAFAFHVANNKTYEDYADPPRCIGEMKKFYSTAGSFYGVLCKRTHIDKTQIKLVRIRNEKDEVSTIINSLDFSLETVSHFILLLDIYCCTFEYCFRSYIGKKNSIYLTQKGKLKKNRPTKKLSEKYGDEYEKVLTRS